MKNVFCILSICIALAACGGGDATKQDDMAPVAGAPATEPAEQFNMLDSARLLILETTELLKLEMTGEMSHEFVNNKIDTLMALYADVYRYLSPEDTLLIHEYRAQKMEELIDLKMKMSE